MCMGKSNSDSGPTAAQLAESARQDQEHQEQMALIANDRAAIQAQNEALTTQQAQFNAQQADFQGTLTAWAKKMAAQGTPSVPLPPGQVQTGADASTITDDQAAAGQTAAKQGRAALRIDLTRTSPNLSGLNIPTG